LAQAGAFLISLKKMVEEGLLLTEGETHNLLYRLGEKRH
jgi:hypothetical protein